MPIIADFNNPLDIKAMPIRSAVISIPNPDLALLEEFNFTGSGLLSESNITIDPVTRTNGSGGEQTLYYKLEAKFYLQYDSSEFQLAIKKCVASKFVDCCIWLGGTGVFAHEGSAYISLSAINNQYVSASVRNESTAGFWRRVLSLTAKLQYYPNINY